MVVVDTQVLHTAENDLKIALSRVDLVRSALVDEQLKLGRGFPQTSGRLNGIYGRLTEIYRELDVARYALKRFDL